MEPQSQQTTGRKQRLPKVTLVRTHPSRPEAVTALQGGGLALWALEDPPRLLAQVETGYDQIGEIAVSSDGLHIALISGWQRGTAAERIEFRTWDDLTPTRKYFVPDASCIDWVSLSADGRWIAAVGPFAVSIMDQTTGEIVATAEAINGGDPNIPLFAPHHPLLAVAGSHQSGCNLHLYRVEKNGQCTFLARSHPGFAEVTIAYSMAFSPDGRWLVLFTNSGSEELWTADLTLYDTQDLATEWAVTLNGKTVGTQTWYLDCGPPENPAEILFHGDSEILYGTHYGHLISLDRTTGKIIRNLTLPKPSDKETASARRRPSSSANQDILSIALHPDGSKVWAALRSGRLCSFPLDPLAPEDLPTPEPTSPKIRPTLPTPPSLQTVTVMALSPDGTRVFAIGTDEEDAPYKILDSRTGELLCTLALPSIYRFYRTVFSPDGRYLAVDFSPRAVRAPRQVVLWDVQSGEKRKTLPNGQPSLLARRGSTGTWGDSLIAFAPDSRRLLVSGTGEHAPLCVWDIETGEKTREFGENIVTAAFSSDGVQIVTASETLQICLWEAASGKLLKRLTRETKREAVLSVTFLDQDTKVLTLDPEKQRVKIWDAKTGRKLQDDRLPEFYIQSVAYSPDGRLLVAGGQDARVWDLTTRSLLCTLRGHSDLIDTIQFSADGNVLATIESGNLRLWDARLFPGI